MYIADIASAKDGDSMRRAFPLLNEAQRLDYRPQLSCLMRPRGIQWILIFGLVASLEALPAAQSRATGADIVGVVRDQTQGVLTGARITARNLETNIERSTTVDEKGQFVIPLLPPGSYDLRIEAPGFAPRTRTIVLDLGSLVQIEVELTVAPIEDRAEVIAEHSVLDLRKTAVGGLVTSPQIERLPIDVRNFISFAAITPGVAFDHTPQQGATATSGLTFAGQRGRSNNITVDGLDNNDAATGGVLASFSQEAVQEFQVLTNSFPAEFGSASGGVVNIVTKSGTNTLTGSAFMFVRDAALNAVGHFEKFDPAGNPISLPKAPHSQKQFGALIGGPLRRDRTFFLGSYERLDIAATNLVTIDDRNTVRHPFFGTPLGTPAQILRNAGFPVETGSVGYAHTIDQFLAKVDHNFASTQKLTMRLHASDTLNENAEPFGGITARSRGASVDANDVSIAASQTSLFSSRWLNELYVQSAYRRQAVRSLDPTCQGICDQADEGGPTLEVVGVASVGRQRVTPQNRKAMTYQVLNTASYFRGSHAIKAGVGLIVRDNRVEDSVLPLHFGGRYVFSPLPAIPGVLPAPISAIQALALGLPAAYVQGYGNDFERLDAGDYSLFAQDDWRLASRLTIRYGVRYQYQGWSDRLQRINGYPGTFPFPADRNDVAPRIGVAWDATGNQKTLVHGAYGVFYDSQIRAIESVPILIDGDTHVRTLVAQFPNPLVLAAWNSPGRRLPQGLAGNFPSLQIAVDPDMQTPYAHHASVGVDRELAGAFRLSVDGMFVRGFNQIGAIDYNPRVASLGFNRRPLDVNGVPGTSASVIQYTSFAQTWYRGLVTSLEKRFQARHHVRLSYTFSKAEDTTTDFQGTFMPQQNGRGRDPNDPSGLPLGFDPMTERGPSTQDQRHRLVLSGFMSVPAGLNVSGIVTVGSGRPNSILAGADLNGDGDGGTFPPDRARTNPAEESTSVPRNSATTPAQATVHMRVSRDFPLSGRSRVDVLFEVFNLFNRTNFMESSHTSSTFIFGPGSYPNQPLPTFGQYTQAGPPRQAQLGLRIAF